MDDVGRSEILTGLGKSTRHRKTRRRRRGGRLRGDADGPEDTLCLRVSSVPGQSIRLLLEPGGESSVSNEHGHQMRKQCQEDPQRQPWSEEC